MSNEVEIIVTGKDRSGPGFDGARAGMRRVSAESDKLSARLEELPKRLKDVAQAANEAARATVTGTRTIGDAVDDVAEDIGGLADVAEEAGRRAGGAFGEGFTRDASGRLRNARGHFVKEIGGLADASEESGRRAGGLFGEGFGSIMRRAFSQLVENGLGAALGVLSGAAGTFFKNTSDAAASMATNLASSIGLAVTSGTAMTAATGGINLLVAALLAAVVAAAALATGFMILAPALLIAGGAAGAATTGLIGLISTAAVLGMGLGGLAGAWQAANAGASGGASSGRAAAAAQKEVKSATTALADAQKAALAAQRAISDARKEETERLEDLSRTLAAARLDEEDAVLGVQRAELRLKEVRGAKDTTALDVREAELAYRQALQSVEDMKDRVADLTEEQEEGNRKGVEGSDAVQRALERQAQAQRQVEEATARLAEAQQGMSSGAGGVDRFAEAMAGLSANGRSLILMLLSLKPQFDALKASVQDRLLAGFDTAVKNLADKWLPVLGPMLGDLADKFNGVGKSIAKALGDTKFIDNVRKATAGFGVFVDKLGKSMSPLIDSFGRLGAASVPFLEKIGDLIAGVVDKFAAWIKAADESGALTSFMEDAAQMLQDLWDIGGLVFGLLGDIVEIFFPSSKRDADNFLGGVKKMLQEVKKWLGDPENQEKIRKWIDDLHEFAEKMVTEVIPAVTDMVLTIDEWIKKIDGWATKLEEWKNGIVRVFDDIGYKADSTVDQIIRAWDRAIDWLGGIPGRARGALAGMWDGIDLGFADSMNSVISKWNRLSFRIGGGSFLGQEIKGMSLGVERIQYMAHGGIATGLVGGMAMVGEHGREIVKLPQGSQVIPNGASERMLAGGGQGTVINLHVDAGMGTDGASVGKQIIAFIKQYEIDNGTRWRTT